MNSINSGVVNAVMYEDAHIIIVRQVCVLFSPVELNQTELYLCLSNKTGTCR